MKQYIQIITTTQKVLLALGILTLMTLPLALLMRSDSIDPYTSILYNIAHMAVFFVMTIRPLADIYTSTTYIRPLVILRKGFGVLSASIITAFILAKLIADPLGYLSSWFTYAYWSPENGAILAHLADITAIILLVTSNNFSKRIMSVWWKRVQRLSYVYFYASAVYVFTQFGSLEVLAYLMIVTLVTSVAYILNRSKAVPQTV